MMRVSHQPAYVLINRPYSETSWIVEVLTKDYGRLSLMAKGARRLKSKLRGVLLPFQPLLISWSGKGEVPTLTAAEIDGGLVELNAERLICGFYCNELLINLLHRHDPHSQLFVDYHHLILHFNQEQALDSIRIASLMRGFERCLIKEIGYEVGFEYESDGKTQINKQKVYYFQQNEGFIPCSPNHPKAIQGDVICQLADQEHQFQHSSQINDFDASVANQGKQLMRDILSQMLGNKKIISRELFYPKMR